MVTTIIEVIGWCGTVAILFAYFALVRNWVRQESRFYHCLNLTGAIALGIVAITKSNYQIVVIEIFWGGIAIMAFLHPPKAKT